MGRKRFRNRAQQRYSWIGLVIALLLLLCAVLLLLDETEFYDATATRDAVRECMRHGRVAYVNRLRDEVSCEVTL